MSALQKSAPTFTPADIAAVAGVPVSLQREWRRQEILPKKDDRGWTRITLDELARIFVLKRIADSGFTLKQAQLASYQAVKPMLAALEQQASSPESDVAAFLKNVLVSANKEKGRGKRPAKKPAESRFLILSQEGDGPSGPLHILPVATLAEVPDNLIVWTALDHRRAAEHFAKAVLERRGPDRQAD